MGAKRQVVEVVLARVAARAGAGPGVDHRTAEIDWVEEIGVVDVVEAVHELPRVDDGVRGERVLVLLLLCRFGGFGVVFGFVGWLERRRFGGEERAVAVGGGGEGDQVVSVAFSDGWVVDERGCEREGFWGLGLVLGLVW